MRYRYVRMLEEISEKEERLVGGKAYNLAVMIRAGMPVPPGFCVLSTAYSEDLDIPKELIEEIISAYNRIGGGEVAVRSSALMEDLPSASFAGQGETLLNVKGEDRLIEAIRECWRSLSSARAEVYRERMKTGGVKSTMAVIVQRMVYPDSAGVIFTRSPWNPEQIIIESGCGLGEKVVSGEITPDRFVLDRRSLEMVEREVASEGRVSSLDDEEVRRLGRIGMEIERIFGDPRDIEWAIQDQEIYILQSRPITAVARDEEIERLRSEEIERLRRIASPRGTVWSRYNLSEVLPAPLPMTWSIISKFMSGKGGFGAAYREMGFMPGKEVLEEPPIDLICGRAYYNLTKEPRFYFADFPFEHDFQELKSDPRKAMYPEPKVNARNAPPIFYLKLPYYLLSMGRAEIRMRRLRKDYDRRVREEIIPNFVRYIQNERQVDLTALDDEGILGKIEEWRDNTLFHFAKDVLKATILARFSLTNLINGLKKEMPEEEAVHLVQELTSALEDDLTVRMNISIWKLAQGEMEMGRFLGLFGHRAVGEFELAQPRWRENPEFVEGMVKMFKEDPELNPEERFRRRRAQREEIEREIGARFSAKWEDIKSELEFTRRYLPFRESVKHYMMMGYELLRLALIELGRRHLSDPQDIFYLTIEELPDLVRGRDFIREISDRKERREKLLRIGLPDVIFSDELERIGDPPIPQEADVLEGVSVCGGVAEGEALVMERPDLDLARGRSGYILVCPSTDPCWTPLFIGARGLVMERGGVLSHGAIVAREFGIPAVVNVQGAMKLIRTGQRVTVNGDKGFVSLT
jgi:pyruvate,water dikinase